MPICGKRLRDHDNVRQRGASLRAHLEGEDRLLRSESTGAKLASSGHHDRRSYSVAATAEANRRKALHDSQG
jgi:hypothetical protein